MIDEVEGNSIVRVCPNLDAPGKDSYFEVRNVVHFASIPSKKCERPHYGSKRDDDPVWEIVCFSPIPEIYCPLRHGSELAIGG